LTIAYYEPDKGYLLWGWIDRRGDEVSWRFIPLGGFRFA